MRCHARPLSRTNGFTLVETLLSLMVSGLIGFAALMMLSGVSGAAVVERETRVAIITRQLSIMRIGSDLRSAAMALAVSNAETLLWKGDSVANGAPDLSELRLLVWSADTGEVIVYESPAGAGDVSFDFDDDLLAAVKPLMGTSAFPAEVKLQGVSSWKLDFDAADVRDARRLRVTATVGDADEIAVIATLRASGDAAP